MKNLKKVLALVLAFACAFTMFAGAAFTDQADISDVNADAVELLTTLNIIQGDPDGSFAPEREVTRAEMAKMIYTIRNNGNDDASPYETVTTSFTDISGHWAEGYIKYLQNTGIVAGKSAYIFDPDSTVTTAEAMKMALVLAGYRADKAELTGTNWLKNTVSLATTVGMTRNVQSAVAGGCTRQDAAQILFNTLTDVWAVQWSDVTSSFLNDSEEGLALGGARITVGRKWMDLRVLVGRMVSSGDLVIADVDGDGITADDAAGKDRFTVDVDSIDDRDLAAGVNPFMTLKDGKDHTDLVGQEVKVLRGDKIDEVYGVYATGTSNVVEATMDQVSVQSDRKVKVDGTTYDTIGTRVYVDLGLAANGAALNENFVGVFGVDGRVAADSVKLIDWDNDGDYETTLVNTVTVAKVNSATSSSLTVGETGSRDEDVFGNTHTIDFDGNSIAEGIAKGDYIAITKNLYDDSWNVVKVDKVEGTVNGLVQNQRKVRVDGEWYTLANSKADTDGDGMFDTYVVPNGRETFTNGDKIVMYTIGNTVYFADSSTGNDANRSVLMVYGSKFNAGAWNDTKQAKVILADGTKKTVNIDALYNANGASVALSDGGAAAAHAIPELDNGRMYRYTIDNDGNYTLHEMAENMTGNAIAGYDAYIDNTNGNVNGSKVQNHMIADDAVVFALIMDGVVIDDAAVYTGKTVKNATQTTWPAIPFGGVLTEDYNGIDYARMFNIRIDDTLDEATNYGYLLTDAVRSKDDNQYIEYTLWNGSEVLNVKEKTDEHREINLLQGDVITYAMNGEGMIKNVKEIADGLNGGVKAAIRGLDGNNLRLVDALGSKTYEVNSDTVAIYVDTAKDGEAQGVAGEGYDYNATGVDNWADYYHTNAIYTLDNDGTTIKFILIDINGNLYTNDDTTPVHDKASYISLDAAEVAGEGGLQELLNKYNKVTITDNYTAVENLTVPANTTLEFAQDFYLGGKTLTNTAGGTVNVKGDFDLQGGTVNGKANVVGKTTIASTLNGELTTGTLVIGTRGIVTANSVITVTGQTDLSNDATGLKSLAGIENGAKLIFKYDQDDTAAAKTFFKGAAAMATALDGDGDVKKGEYVMTATVTADIAYTHVFLTAASADEAYDGITPDGSSDNAAAIDNALSNYDAVEIDAGTKTALVKTDLTIETGKTLTVTGAQGLTLNGTGKTLTVEGTVNASKLTLTDGTLSVAQGATVTAGAIDVDATNGKLDGAGTIKVTGSQDVSKIKAPETTATLTLDLTGATISGAPAATTWYVADVALGTTDAVPAGTYKAVNGKWVLQSLASSVTTLTLKAATATNDNLATLAKAGYTNVTVSDALDDATTVPAGMTLTVKASTTTTTGTVSVSKDATLVFVDATIPQATVTIAAGGTVELNTTGEVNFNNITASADGAYVKITKIGASSTNIATKFLFSNGVPVGPTNAAGHTYVSTGTYFQAQ